jgi:ATP-dependent Clp protease, protease subunit
MSEKELPERHSKALNDKIDFALFEQRRIFLSDAVDSDSAKDIIRQLWYLDHSAPNKPILFIINSPGGSVDAGFAVWDQIHLITAPVITLVTGLAASMGSLLSLAAKKGRRLATQNARIMIHQPLIGGIIRGQATDLDIQAREILKTRAMIVSIYAEATGKSIEVIDKAIDRDNWMTATEAQAFGLIDHVVHSGHEIDRHVAAGT